MKFQRILIDQNQKIKEEEKTNNTKVNALKSSALTSQRAKSFANVFYNLPNDMMDSDDPSTTLLLQVILYLSTNTIKDSYHNILGNMGEFPDLKKRTVAASMMWNWGESISVMGSDTCVS